jgi:hypothetical protein
VWFVWSDERVNHSNSYSRPKTKINSHSASFLGYDGGMIRVALPAAQRKTLHRP